MTISHSLREGCIVQENLRDIRFIGKKKDGIAHLCQSLLQKIFTHFTLPKDIALLHVSRNFNWHAKKLITNIDLRGSRQCSLVNEQTIQYFASFPLRCLYLRNCGNINNQSLDALKSKGIELFSLEGCRQVNGNGLNYLPASLKELHISHTYKVYGAQVPLRNFTELRTLNLNHCYRLTNSSLQGIASSITDLNLSGCESLTDHALPYLSSLTNLTRLSLSRLPLLKKNPLIALKELSSITHLDLSYLQITNTALAFCAKFPLKTLNLAHCNHLSHPALQFLIDKPITCLNISYCTNMKNSAMSHMQTMPLKFLNISGCISITNNGLLQLSEMRTLRTIYLSGCNQLSETGMRELPKSIKMIDLRGCYCIPVDVIERFIKSGVRVLA